MGGNATKLIPLLQKMPWDVMTIGNHEIYHHATVTKMLEAGGLLDTFQDGYLTSNVVYSANTSQPLGKRFKVLHGEHSNVLVFGFLYSKYNNGFGRRCVVVLTLCGYMLTLRHPVSSYFFYSHPTYISLSLSVSFFSYFLNT